MDFVIVFLVLFGPGHMLLREAEEHQLRAPDEGDQARDADTRRVLWVVPMVGGENVSLAWLETLRWGE